MRLVAARIVNDVSYVTDISPASNETLSLEGNPTVKMEGNPYINAYGPMALISRHSHETLGGPPAFT